MSNKNVKIGDIFYSSWGYDQTNIDYYMVTKIIGKTFVEIQKIESQLFLKIWKITVKLNLKKV